MQPSFRRLLVLIVLALIFAALFALNRSIASWQHTIIAGDPGALLYAASFDGGSADGFNGDWEQYDGRLSASVDGGALRIKVDEAGGGAYSVADAYFGDFDLRVAARAVEGPEDNGYGVVFRLQNQDNSAVADDSYYLFLISSDGYYRVERALDGQQQVLSDWIASPLIEQGIDVTNALRVVARGDQFQFFINDQAVVLCLSTGDTPVGQAIYNPSSGECLGGEAVDSLTDGSIPNGQIGVTAKWTAGAGGAAVVAAFDNLLVYVPETS